MEEKTKKGEYWKHYEHYKKMIASNSIPIMFYGPNTDDRVAFIKKIASDYPFSGDPGQQYVLYTDDFGIEDDGKKEKPELVDYNDVLAKNYLSLGIIKSFIEDIKNKCPELAEEGLSKSIELKSTFGAIGIMELLEMMDSEMDLIISTYHSPPSNLDSTFSNYGSPRQFLIGFLRPQASIKNFCSYIGATQNISFVLDVRRSLAPASIHAINDLIADRDSTRVILPDGYDWRVVREGEKHQFVHDFSYEFLTEASEKLFKEKLMRRF